MDASLTPLLNTIDTRAFEEGDDWLELRALSRQGADATITLLLHRQGGLNEQWKIQCRKVEAITIRGPLSHFDLDLEEDHPAAWPFVHPTAELFFTGAASEPDALVGRLLEAHRGLGGDGLNPFDYLNASSDLPLTRLLSGHFGKLAAGPLPLVRRYREVLDEAGLRTSVIEPKPFTWPEEDHDEEDDGPPSALIMDHSFVVAHDFSATWQKTTTETIAWLLLALVAGLLGYYLAFEFFHRPMAQAVAPLFAAGVLLMGLKSPVKRWCAGIITAVLIVAIGIPVHQATRRATVVVNQTPSKLLVSIDFGGGGGLLGMMPPGGEEKKVFHQWGPADPKVKVLGRWPEILEGFPEGSFTASGDPGGNVESETPWKITQDTIPDGHRLTILGPTDVPDAE